MSLQASRSQLKIILSKPIAQVRKVLKNADWNLVRALTELALNLVLGNVDLTRAQQAKVKKHIRLLKKLADRKLSLTNKKLILARSRNAPKALKEILRVLVKAVGWLKGWL